MVSLDWFSYNHEVCWSAVFLQCPYQVGNQEVGASPRSEKVYLLSTQFPEEFLHNLHCFFPKYLVECTIELILTRASLCRGIGMYIWGG